MDERHLLGRYVSRVWQYDSAHYVPPQYRTSCTYDAFVPAPIAHLDISLSGSVASSISDAETAIRDLNAPAHPALAPFARLLLRTESIASSKVEGMQVDARSLARAEASGDVGRRVSTTALEIIANIDAMQLAIETATDNETVELDHFIEIHAELMRRAPNSIIAGRIRLDQNWIGGNNYNPCGADFVPPPPNDVLPLLADLSQFCSDDRVPPLVQAALAHAQFETIHPFEDGNGRTGRALVQVILRRRRLAPNFVPPISVILASHRESYINGLTAYREGRLDEWLELFAVSAARAARHARQYLTRVEELQERWRVVLRATGPIRVDAAVWRLIDELPALPVVTSATAVARTDRSKPVVNRAIDQLAEVGIIAPVTQSQRYRAWEVPELLELLVGLENGDSSPTV